MASTPRRMHTLTLLSDPAVTISVGNPTSSLVAGLPLLSLYVNFLFLGLDSGIPHCIRKTLFSHKVAVCLTPLARAHINPNHAITAREPQTGVEHTTPASPSADARPKSISARAPQRTPCTHHHTTARPNPNPFCATSLPLARGGRPPPRARHTTPAHPARPHTHGPVPAQPPAPPTAPRPAHYNAQLDPHTPRARPGQRLPHP